MVAESTFYKILNFNELLSQNGQKSRFCSEKSPFFWGCKSRAFFATAQIFRQKKIKKFMKSYITQNQKFFVNFSSSALKLSRSKALPLFSSQENSMSKNQSQKK